MRVCQHQQVLEEKRRQVEQSQPHRTRSGVENEWKGVVQRNKTESKIRPMRKRERDAASVRQRNAVLESEVDQVETQAK